MIFSIALSGATTTVLGIDFFSRAGLKEFWLYVWGLNDKIFPLETNSFPMTRGIRVEIAAIVVITCFGIISQMKLWQVIKLKREERDAERKVRQADIEAMEAENGRRIEETAERDREIWEKQYGDKSKTKSKTSTEEQQQSPSASAELKQQKHLSRDSGLGQSSKNSTDSGSGKNIATDAIEMVGLAQVAEGIENSSLVPPHARGGDATTQPTTETTNPQSEPVTAPVPAGPPEPKFFAPAVVIREKGDIEEPTQPSSQNGIAAPTTVHTVIIDPSKVEDDDDASSLATFADSILDDKRRSAAISIASIQPLENIQEVPHDDAASSVAGVMDDEEDERSEDEMPLVGDDNGKRRSSVLSVTGRRGSWNSMKRMSIVSLGRKSSLRSNKSNRPLSSQSQALQSPVDSISGKLEGDKKGSMESSEDTPRTLTPEAEKGEGRRLSLTPEPQPVATEASEKDATEKGSQGQAAPSSPVQEAAGLTVPQSRKEGKTAPAPIPPAAPLRHGSLQHVRPPSKIVKTYRVSEWAKHLDPADEPQYDDIEPTDPSETAQEKAAPVHFMELQEGASSARVPPPIQGLNRSDTLNSHMNGGISRTNTLTTIREAPAFTPVTQQQALGIQIPAPVHQLATSQTPSSPQIPTVVVASPPPSRGGPHPLATPMLSQPLVESPTEDVDMDLQRTASPTPSQLPPMCETLLTKRESLLKATPSFSTVADNTLTYGQSMTQPQPVFQSTFSPSASATSLLTRNSMSPSLVQQHRNSNGTIYAGSMISAMGPSSRIPSMEMQPSPISNFSPYMSQVNASSMGSIPIPQGAVETAPLAPPQPAPADRRESMLRAWRESLMQDQVISKRTQHSIQDRRNMMIQEQAMMNAYEKQREMGRGVVEEVVDERYKQRDMLQIHRNAMKKMQEKAKGI
ncbi:hypothetical protein ABW20_dc0106890 [Dactylellina cionopaga]|nr:hypothetical protein ABW20_dc0106890 [Dactylellina cionopaga]